ncbi:MAG: glucokinase, partial [Caldimonas sp.]
MSSSSDAPYPRLVGDVGGTQARFGWVGRAGDEVGHVAAYPGDDYPGLAAVIHHYLAEQSRPAPASCAIGVAGAVVGERVELTNRNWSVSAADLKREFGLERMVLLNDFAALAFALPTLQPDELVRVGGGAGLPGAPLALLGAGTGLGVSGLLAQGSVPVTGEGGHVSLCAEDDEQDQILSILRGWFGRVSAERALSGPGLVNLHRASCIVASRPDTVLEPRDVIERALDGSDAQCVEAVELFFAFLGSVAGDLALTLGARGGVYVGGGIVPRLGDWIGRSTFRRRFEAKGRFASYLADIPVWVISATESPALRGADRALD